MVKANFSRGISKRCRPDVSMYQRPGTWGLLAKVLNVIYKENTLIVPGGRFAQGDTASKAVGPSCHRCESG